MRRAASALAAAALVGAGAAPAGAQTPSGNRALILLDASKSMNKDAGNGGTRLDAAKQAVHSLLDRLPPGAPLGLRVYGSRLAHVPRAQACRDSVLAVPVGPLDKAALRARVDALDGVGRTPIGRSLLAAPADLGSAPGRRSVVLVSDGGDNCAPPDPCKAARVVSRQGIDLTISVVGLQVDASARRQLRCIARAGGGDYVDVRDAGRLGDELAATLARAFRSYEPSGTRIVGGPVAGRAAPIGTGLFQDVLRPGQQRWYAIDLRRGQRLFAAASAIPNRTAAGNGALKVTLLDPRGQEVDSASDVLSGAAAGDVGRVRTESLRTAGAAGSGPVPAGRYRLGVAVEAGDLEPLPVPVELGVQAVGPGQLPGLVRAAGTLPRPAPAAAAPRPQSSPSDGLTWGVVAAIGGAAAALGLGTALALRRRGSAA